MLLPGKSASISFIVRSVKSLDLGVKRTAFVLADFAVFFKFFDMVHAVLADISCGDAGMLGVFFRNFHEFLALS